MHDVTLVTHVKVAVVVVVDVVGGRRRRRRRQRASSSSSVVESAQTRTRFAVDAHGVCSSTKFAELSTCAKIKALVNHHRRHRVRVVRAIVRWCALKARARARVQWFTDYVNILARVLYKYKYAQFCTAYAQHGTLGLGDGEGRCETQTIFES